jgi:hypothetical protein
VKLHSVFLRAGCILPERVTPRQRTFAEHWILVEEIAAPVFDTMIRQAGWHFIWLAGGCSRRGCARTQEAAIDHALARALKAGTRHCNAAELESLEVMRFPGFHVAHVTVQPRQIQKHASLESNRVNSLQPDPAR